MKKKYLIYLPVFWWDNKTRNHQTILVSGKNKADAIASAERKSQVRTVDRSERIRTYNYPENRLSDHRVNYKSNNLDAVLNGELDDVIQALLDADKAAKLASTEK